MNHVDRILEYAKRVKTKLIIVCVGSLALAAALTVVAPNTGISESPLLPNNLPFENPSGPSRNIQHQRIDRFKE